MVDMPEPVVRMIKHPDTNKVMATVSPDGLPHVIVCGSLIVTDPDTIVVGEVFMQRTCEYLRNNPEVEFLVWKGKEAYSVKATYISRIDTGPVFDRISQMLEKMNMDVIAAQIYRVNGVWDESASPSSGDRVV